MNGTIWICLNRQLNLTNQTASKVEQSNCVSLIWPIVHCVAVAARTQAYSQRTFLVDELETHKHIVIIIIEQAEQAS